MSDETLRASEHVAHDPNQRREYTLCYRERTRGSFGA